MAPAYVANMSAFLITFWNGWNRPISRRWLGSHKTVLGFVAGTLGALATAFVQHIIGVGGSSNSGRNSRSAEVARHWFRMAWHDAQR